MFRLILLVLSVVLSHGVRAQDTSTSVFYPLPTHAEGKGIAAKHLFPGQEGGLWIHDVHGQVRFFDGEHLLPRSGSVLDYQAKQLVFSAGAFWTFADNEVFKTFPNQERKGVFSLTPGNVIRKIGASGGFLWVSDDRHFYTYDMQSEELRSYSLMPLYQHNQSSRIQINDARLVRSKWVLATNSGVYLSEGEQFTHVVSSGKQHIETIYFSEQRNQLLIGTLKGAVIINIDDPQQEERWIGDTHVLAITESADEYWIGTENGLFVYSIAQQQTRKYTGVGRDEYTLSGNKVYALVNDHTGGIWIGTNRGVHYISLFARNFERYADSSTSNGREGGSLQAIVPQRDNDDFWLITNLGVDRLISDKVPQRIQLYSGQVNDLVELDSQLILATPHGLVCINKLTGQVLQNALLPALKGKAVQQLELDEQKTLWGVSDNDLWSYDVSRQHLKEYGRQWLIEAYLPAQVTDLLATLTQGIVIGTDHGIYRLRRGNIQFVKDSERYGQVIDIETDYQDGVWVAGTYGVFRLSPDTESLTPVSLVDLNIGPRCLVAQGPYMWLTSSAGLSLYNSQQQLKKHFSAPFGLIMNEFVSRQCALDNSLAPALIFGSKYGLIRARSSQLLDQDIPSGKVLFSRVSIDNQTLATGGRPPHLVPVRYGDSVSFLFGTMPQSNSRQVEYQINQEGWHALQGSQLTLDHLMPGTYTITVRSRLPHDRVSAENALQFIVNEPWYLTWWAKLAGMVVVLLLLSTLIWWRSRLMMRANKQLKAQVALKTDQLRHQSRILLTNNQQLRKQLQIRKMLQTQKNKELEARLVSASEALLQSGEPQGLKTTLQRRIRQEFACLDQTEGHQGVVVLYPLLDTVLQGWQEEFDKAGIQVELRTENAAARTSQIQITEDNLDMVFNTLFASLLRRGYCHQTVVLSLEQTAVEVLLRVIDYGQRLPDLQRRYIGDEKDLNVLNLPSLVDRSGGCLHCFSSEERNFLEFSWSLAVDLELARDQMHKSTQCETATRSDLCQQEWLDNVTCLIERYFRDPDFGTTVIANCLYTSERSFQRRFKQATGRTFKEYLTEFRLEHACRQLLSGHKVSEVAFDCGFNDPSYFSQRFRTYFGVSPTQFVETHSEPLSSDD